MLKIGYVRPRDEDPHDAVATLESLGCQVIRAEEAFVDTSVGPVLSAILEFIAEGDQLIVSRLEHLAASSRDLLEIVDRLEVRGASLHVAEPELTTEGAGGRALKAVLEAVGSLEPGGSLRRRRTSAEAQEIRALKRAGVGPVEIARRLGVSRMTVWRKLRDLEAQA